MRLPFRDYHLLALLEEYERQLGPMDLFISQYFRANKAIGSKDRAFIAEAAYGMTRWRGLLDALCSRPIDWQKRFACYRTLRPEEYSSREEIPQHVRLSFPKDLFQRIVESHGSEQAKRICLASNSPAPTTVRVNPLKTTREEMLKLWQKKYDVAPCRHSPLGIVFHKKINFFTLEEFKEGLFEVQDEGSQLLADLVQAKPGQHVMDYCSGSGGKTLAFVHRMNGEGQVYLHDVRPSVLRECKKRLRRAGVQNAQIIPHDSPRLCGLKGRMDWVLVDAPCTGTGTLRRNPDMKWKYTDTMLEELVAKQREIFANALTYLKPTGKIVYATCSLLRHENQDQVDYFHETYGLEMQEEPFQSVPVPGEMDGFFGAKLRIITHS